MNLRILGTGSSGNSYLLQNDDTALVIECGISGRHIKKALDFNVSKVEAAFALHAHGDHSSKVKDFLSSGIQVYGSKDVCEKYPGCKLIEHKKMIKLGQWSILPLEVKHDVENFCLLIRHPETGLTLYASDCHYLPYKFKGLNNMLIEANYDLKLLDENIANGSLPTFLRERIINSHMDIETVKGVMKSNDLTQVNKIVLIHLSSGNSDAGRFQTEIQELTGKKTYIAEAGMELEFNKEF